MMIKLEDLEGYIQRVGLRDRRPTRINVLPEVIGEIICSVCDNGYFCRERTRKGRCKQ